ncbi:glutamyl-tRNA reductase [Granulicella mallensis]|uniref:Glutamyl-tRNA reductase n=1 Tax=Granulicella mallensis (strain ATCC BAA-1857 / DSM 23137 / MP5ACTX8) TaxID=682795 RepID=G8NVP2_GRAMM|nr:glutamyl-tRNA reductase [Granulicella mallensis]AEU37714.1 glutamyl-tRNA reductase [Granulicella mallensis MP5ACTX8]
MSELKTNSGSILLLGVNHTTAPLDVRERLAIPVSRLADATRTLAHQPGVREALILSTCNRVELLTVQDAPQASSVPPMGMLRFLHDYLNLPANEIEPHVYEFREREAIRHLFRVASSLDSMVVGEPQILGQVKQSWTVAREVGAVRSTLDPLLQRAFSVAKKVRTETQIGSSTVSIASVAAELARKIFGSLNGKTVLIVGAGKMSDLAARHLIQQGATTLLVSNRTEARAEKIADSLRTPSITTGVIPFEQLHEQSHRADIVITSTGAGHVFTPDRARALLQRRRNRPVFFIDIAVPRDVAPEINKLEGCFVYDMDDLQQVAAQNQAVRSREAEAAESIVSREVELYGERLAQAPAAQAIKQLMLEAEALRQQELARTAQRLSPQPLTPEQQAAIEALTKSLTAKLLHPQIAALRGAANASESDE